MGDTERVPLTDRQREVYEFICRFWGDNGKWPTTRQIAASVLSSRHVNASTPHLRALVKKGWVQKRPGGVIVPELSALAHRSARDHLARVDPHAQMLAALRRVLDHVDHGAPHERGSVVADVQAAIAAGEGRAHAPA